MKKLKVKKPRGKKHVPKTATPKFIKEQRERDKATVTAIRNRFVGSGQLDLDDFDILLAFANNDYDMSTDALMRNIRALLLEKKGPYPYD